MTEITATPFQSNLVAERFVEHRRNLGFFKKLRIEVNDIGKRVQSFFSKTTCGLVSNPFSASTLHPLGAPRYAQPPTEETARRDAQSFIHHRNAAIAALSTTFRQKAALFKSECPDQAALATQAELATHYALKQYEKALALEIAADTNDPMEDAFLAHYLTQYNPISSSHYREELVISTKCAHSDISRLLIGNATGIRGISAKDIDDQCILSFRQARKDIFYQALRENPQLRSQIGSRAPQLAAQYDMDFATLLKDKLDANDRRPLPDLLMETHGVVRFRAPSSAGYTEMFLDGLTDKLKIYTSAPILLSKMAAHAVPAIQDIYRRKQKARPENAATTPALNTMASSSSTPRGAISESLEKSATPESSNIAETRKIFAELYASDRRAVNEFSVDFDEALLQVLTDHWATFREVLDLSEWDSPESMSKSMAKPYMADFVDAFMGVRRLDRVGYTVALPLRVAHGLAISAAFHRTALRGAPLKQLTGLLNATIPIGSQDNAAKEWIERHRPTQVNQFL